MTDGPLPDADSQFGSRLRERLQDEQVIWLTTVGADGSPQPNPVWFVWRDPDTVVTFNRADAHRLLHVSYRPRVALHFNSNRGGGDVGVMVGRAELDDAQPPPHEDDGYRAKYAEAMTRVSGSQEQFSAEYPVAMLIRIDRVRGF